MVEMDLDMLKGNDKKDKIFLAGHNGLVGTAILNAFKRVIKTLLLLVKKNLTY